jgi:hypothetical protein
MVGSKRTGDLLVKAGLIQPAELEEARRVQARQGGSLGRALKGSGASTKPAWLSPSPDC